MAAPLSADQKESQPANAGERPGDIYLLLSLGVDRRAYNRYRERQRLQKEDDKRSIEALNARLAALEVDRADLAQRVELLQKVRHRKHLHPLP